MRCCSKSHSTTNQCTHTMTKHITTIPATSGCSCRSARWHPGSNDSCICRAHSSASSHLLLLPLQGQLSSSSQTMIAFSRHRHQLYCCSCIAPSFPTSNSLQLLCIGNIRIPLLHASLLAALKHATQKGLKYAVTEQRSQKQHSS